MPTEHTAKPIMMNTKQPKILAHGLLAGLLVVASLSLTAPAFADVVPDEVAACQNAFEGAPCSSLSIERGVCLPDTCSRINYQTPNRRTESYDCLRCEPATSAVFASPVGIAVTGGSIAVGGLLAFFIYRRRKSKSDDGDDL